MPRIPSHPGEVLSEDLRALEMSAAALARQLQVPANRITAILTGQRSITGDTALRLAHLLGTSPSFSSTFRACMNSASPNRKPASPSNPSPPSNPARAQQQRGAPEAAPTAGAGWTRQSASKLWLSGDHSPSRPETER